MSRGIVVALLLSLGLHAVGFGVFYQREEIVVQGGAPVSVARLGNSFADMASGIEAPVAPDMTEAVEQEGAAPKLVTETVTAVKEVAPSPIPLPEQGLVVATRIEKPLAPVVTAPRSQAAPVHPETSAPYATDGRITGTAPIVAQEADATTERPQARPERRRDHAEDRAARQVPRGNAAQDTTRGSSSGIREARADSAVSSNRNAAQKGNSAAITNYPGQVWSKLQRGKRARSTERGAAVVAFRVAPSGGLAGLSITRSSGNARLDKAALRHVRRAAPFPPPPRGAKTRFNFTYEVK